MAKMIDLVKRLELNWKAWGSPTDRDTCVNETCMAMNCKEAADRIRALETDLAEKTSDCLRWHSAYMDLSRGEPLFPYDPAGKDPFDVHPDSQAQREAK